MSNTPLLVAFFLYTIMLFVIAWLTSRKADQKAFYIGDRKSNWMLVAYGMIGASLSGVTFMSVPGNVLKQNFYYFQMVIGFPVGYAVIAFILVPLYYRLNLTSIYTYLEHRFGFYSYKTGAVFFLLSRMLGAAIRAFVVIMVLHSFVLTQMNIPFWLVGLIFILLVIAYTYQGGVKTIIWTDSIQTTFMLLAVVITIAMIASALNISLGQLFSQVAQSDYAKMIDLDWGSKTNFFKQFLAGVFMPIAMTGLDQGMMQKSLSCKTMWDSQKNMLVSAGLIVIVNFVFLALGVILAIFCQQRGIIADPSIADPDRVFPIVALQYLGPVAGVCFFIGLISAAYPCTANAITALTTSTCVDLVNLEKRKNMSDQKKTRIRQLVQCVVTLVFLCVILLVNELKDKTAIITIVYQMAAYTYGPLLGLYVFGLFTRRRVFDKCVPLICVAAPLVCLGIEYSNVIGQIADRFRPQDAKPLVFGFGFALLLVNAALTWIGLWCCSRAPRQGETDCTVVSQEK